MKYRFSILLITVAFLILGCKKDNNTSCNLPSFDIYTEGGTADVTISGSSAGFYEIEYGPSGFTKGTGTKKNASGSTNIENIPLGTYDMYVRGNCGSSNYSDWAGPESFLIDGSTSSCYTPTSLRVSVSSNSYDADWYSHNDYYDLEIGETGFKLGTGRQLRVNEDYLSLDPSDFIQGKTYDMYVRGNCGGSSYSKWAGPKSFYASLPGGTGSCSKPTSVSSYKLNSREISYEFIGHSSSYQISFSAYSDDYGSLIDTDRSSGTYGFSSSTTSLNYFWARGKCGVSSYTDWVVVKIN